MFGARGTSTLFSKLTAVFAALFFVTSLTLAYLGTRAPSEPTSVLERAAQTQCDGVAPAGAGARACGTGAGRCARGADAPRSAVDSNRSSR